MKKKILIRIGSLRHGGAEKVLVTFLKNIPSDLYEVDLLLNLGSGKYLKEVPSWVKILYIFKGEMITTNRLQDIFPKAKRVLLQKLFLKFPNLIYKRILKGKKYDIEFAAIHGMRDEILGSPLRDSKKIVWIHNDLRKTEFHNYTDEELRKFFGFDRIMVISNQIETDFQNLADSDQERKKIVRIYNPLDTQEILNKSKFQAKNYAFSKDQPTFISVGTIFPQKGFDRLLRVHKKLRDEGFNHHVLLVGDGYDFENIKNLRDKLNLQDSVEMIGFTDNPYPYFREAEFFILSSRYEGFPTVLYEAVTLEKIIVATDVSGVREILDNGKLGLIVENSENGLYQGMKNILTNKDILKEYKNNISNYTYPFSLEKSVTQIQKIIDDL